MKTFVKLGTLAAGLLLTVIAPLANARDNIDWSVTIGTPAPIYAPPPVVYAPPPPVYVQPVPRYYPPQAYLVQPAPVYVQPPFVVQYENRYRGGYGGRRHGPDRDYHHGHWRHHHD